MKSLEQFKNDITEQEKEELRAYVEAQTAEGRSSADAVVEYIRGKGYEVTEDDLQPLDDDDLENVSGGSGPTGEDVTEGVRAYCGNCQRSVLAKPTGKDDGGFFQWRQYEYICPICNGTFWN